MLTLTLTLLAFAASTATTASAHHASKHTVRMLDRATAGTPLAHTGRILEPIARRYRISPFFIVAVSATESSIGRVPCRNNRLNVWGLASCVNSWPVPYFDTWREAYTFYAAFLTRHWPPEWRQLLITLPANERNHLILLTALLDAQPHE